MLDISEILMDADLCSSFDIIRSTGKCAAGGWQTTSTQTLHSFGAVRNSSGKELAMLPESDRPTEALTFRSVDQMFVTNGQNSQLSDVLVYQGDQYRVMLVKNYSDQGYWFTLATRLSGK